MTELAESTDAADLIEPMSVDSIDQKELAERLLEQAKEQNIELVGPGGLLGQLTKSVLETALDAEMNEHLGYEKHDRAGHNSGNSRNGTRAKTVLTEIGPVEIEVPRDTESTFEPQIVRKRQRRLTGVDEIVLSLTARGLTTGEIAAHFQEVYGAKISKDTVSRITEKVTGEMTEWLHRPLDTVYPVIFIDAMVVKVRDGQVVNKLGVCRDRRERGRQAGHPRALGRRWGRGREVLAWRVHRDQEPRRSGRLYRGLRRPEGPPGGDHDDLGARDRPSLCDPSDPQHIQVRITQVLGRDEPGPQAGLHRALRGRRQGALRGVRREVGQAVPGDQQAVGERLERVHTVPGLRCRDPARDLQHERDRVDQRALPPSCTRARAFPERHGRAEVPLPRHTALDPTGRGKARWGMRWKPALNAFAIAFEGRIH
jgi:putative transposase